MRRMYERLRESVGDRVRERVGKNYREWEKVCEKKWVERILER